MSSYRYFPSYRSLTPDERKDRKRRRKNEIDVVHIRHVYTKKYRMFFLGGGLPLYLEKMKFQGRHCFTQSFLCMILNLTSNVNFYVLSTFRKSCGRRNLYIKQTQASKFHFFKIERYTSKPPSPLPIKIRTLCFWGSFLKHMFVVWIGLL